MFLSSRVAQAILLDLQLLFNMMFVIFIPLPRTFVVFDFGTAALSGLSLDFAGAPGASNYRLG